MGIRAGMPIDDALLVLGLKAVRLTDRFSEVRGRLEATPGGTIVHIELLPWPALRAWSQEGSLPVPIKKDLFPGLRKGMRIGDLRLEQFRLVAETRLREFGYPNAKVLAHRVDGGASLRFELLPGVPDLIRSLEYRGDAGIYGSKTLLKLLKVEPGRTLWTEEFRRGAVARIRQRFVKDKRFQGQADLAFDENGILSLSAAPGPIVRLVAEGAGLGFKSLKDLMPLARSERYSPELLDAGARSIVRFLRAKGHLDANVTHRTEVLRGSPQNPEEVQVTYVLAAGERFKVTGVRFERNQEISTAELEKVVDLPTSWLGLRSPRWTTDLINAVEERTKALYRSRGFSDISLRRMPLEGKDGSGTLVLQVREGAQRMLESITLELPADPAFKPWFLAESLAFVLGEHPKLIAIDSDSVRRYRSENPGLPKVQGKVLELDTPGKVGIRTFQLQFDRAIPLLKNDLAQMLGVLRRRIGALGALRPLQKLKYETGTEGTRVLIEVPLQPLASIRRLVVQGSDKTRARAILQETQLDPGLPLDSDRMAKAQAQVGNLGGL
ncbi:MAG: POTRA domain-containing protein, partial [Holophaga sp.]|nr:POTRA domain-containing protein [Holophaga sp.]